MQGLVGPDEDHLWAFFERDEEVTYNHNYYGYGCCSPAARWGMHRCYRPVVRAQPLLHCIARIDATGLLFARELVLHMSRDLLRCCFDTDLTSLRRYVGGGLLVV